MVTRESVQVHLGASFGKSGMSRLRIDDAPDLLVKARGATLIKGRGRMLTYWVSEVV